MFNFKERASGGLIFCLTLEGLALVILGWGSVSKSLNPRLESVHHRADIEIDKVFRVILRENRVTLLKIRGIKGFFTKK